MRDHYDEFRRRGAEIVAIGMGIPAMAADFKAKQQIPFPLVVDRTKETYRLLELTKSSGWNVFGPPVWLKGIKSILKGNPNAIPKQDPMQLSGAVVARRGGEIVLVHRATRSYDFYPVDKLLKAADDAAAD